MEKRPIGRMFWDLWRDSIVYMTESDEGTRIISYDLSTGSQRELVNLGANARVSPGMSVSPDGKWIVFAKSEAAGGDITLVEDFR